MFRAVLPLARYEIQRNLRPALVLPLTGFCMLLAYERVHGPRGLDQGQVQGALTLHGGWLHVAIPLLAGIVGGSLAEEQRTGVTSILFARGVTRGQYLLSKILGAAGSAVVLTAVAIAGFYLLVGILWPAGRIVLHYGPAGPPGPLPALQAVNPLANDLLLAAMSLAASGGMAVVGVLTGTLTTNRYVAMVAPLGLYIVTATLHEYGINRVLNPYTYLDLSGYYRLTIPVPWLPYAAFLYWSCFAVVLAALARWVFARRELT